MGIRDRLIDWASGGQISRQQSAIAGLTRAYSEIATEIDVNNFREQYYGIDDAIMQDVINSLEYERIGGYSDGDGEAQRKRALLSSRAMWLSSPVAQWCVWGFTNNGLGERVQISALDEQADEVWNEFWTASRNEALLSDASLRKLSNDLLVTGNRFLVYFANTTSGLSTVREIEPDEITEIITAKGDASTPIWYKRQYQSNGKQKTLYYPDWHALFDGTLENVEDPPKADERANESGQLVCVQHIANNRKTKSLLGWPLLTVAAPAMREHKNFLQDRLTVSRSKAAYTREFITQGGSRAVQSLRSTLNSTLGASSSYIDRNPPAVAGSQLIHNQAVEMRDLPMSTGAGDAKTDHDMFAWYAGLGGGALPPQLGLDMQRYATALTMDKSQQILYNNYTNFWVSQFEAMVEIVLSLYEIVGVKFDDKQSQVSIDSLGLADFVPVSGEVSGLLDVINKQFTAGVLPQNAARQLSARLWRVVLSALNVQDAHEITQDANFGVTETAEMSDALNVVIERYQAGQVDEEMLLEALLAEVVDIRIDELAEAGIEKENCDGCKD